MGATASASARILQALRHRHALIISSSNVSRSAVIYSAFYCTVSSSVSSETSPLAGFLQRECGFSPENVKHVCRRKPDLLRQKSFDDLEKILIFLKQRGFTQIDVRKLILKCPGILRLNFQVTVKPKLEFLEKIGLTSEKLLNLLTKNPTLLNRDLIPRISYLQSVLDPKPSDRDSNQRPGELPQKFEAEGRRTLYIICKQPRILGRCVATTLVKLVKLVEGLGIEKGSKMFGHALIMFSRMSEKTVKRKMQNLAELGFSEEEVGMIVRRMPPILEASEERLRQNMKFLMEEWKLPRDIIPKSPALLQYNLEKRMRPRLKVLQSAASARLVPKKSYFSPIFISMSDEVFRQKIGSRLPVLMEGEGLS